MHKTKNDLPEASRSKMADLLNSRLADAIDLMLRAKQAHWNVKGPTFIALHELFDKVNEESEEWVDLIAERVVQFGGTAEGTLPVVGKRSTLKEYPLGITAGPDHVEALASSLAAFGKLVRHAIEQSAELRDQGTSDLFTEISRATDKLLWFVESHLG